MSLCGSYLAPLFAYPLLWGHKQNQHYLLELLQIVCCNGEYMSCTCFYEKQNKKKTTEKYRKSKTIFTELSSNTQLHIKAPDKRDTSEINFLRPDVLLLFWYCRRHKLVAFSGLAQVCVNALTGEIPPCLGILDFIISLKHTSSKLSQHTFKQQRNMKISINQLSYSFLSLVLACFSPSLGCVNPFAFSQN